MICECTTLKNVFYLFLYKLTFDLFYAISCSKWSRDLHCRIFSADRTEKLSLIVSSGLFFCLKTTSGYKQNP